MTFLHMDAMRETARIKQIMRVLLGESITTWIHAVRFCWLARYALQQQQEVEMRLIPKLVSEGDVVVDIGANGANWTLLLSQYAGSTGAVYAFEADPYYAKATAKTISLLRLKNVIFFPFGLSDRRETTDFLIRTSEGNRVSGTGRVVRNKDKQVVPEDYTVKVKLGRLDDLTQSYPALLSAKLIKCHTEGFELMVFRGSKDVLSKARPIIITGVGHARLQDYEEQELLNFFRDREYRCYMFTPHAQSSRRFTEIKGWSENLSNNIIMIPKERVGKLEVESF